MIIADFYNANPSSMEVALTNLAELAHPNKLAILGEMRELGVVSSVEHEKIIHLCKTLNIDAIFVGQEFCRHHPLLCFDDVEALNDYLQKKSMTKKLILIIGSRGVHLEKIHI
jgi:UDP-N-acetylmuramoyl-tripeptide--D-alanyl-D-alanine ligase